MAKVVFGAREGVFWKEVHGFTWRRRRRRRKSEERKVRGVGKRVKKK